MHQPDAEEPRPPQELAIGVPQFDEQRRGADATQTRLRTLRRRARPAGPTTPTEGVLALRATRPPAHL